MNAPLSEADIRASIRAARETRDAQTRARLQPLFALSTLPKPGELARLAKAERKLASPEARRRTSGADDRDAALVAYSNRLLAENDQRRREELTALITASGGEIIGEGAKGVRGRLRILSHDGLAYSDLSPRLKQAGLLFRAAYETAVPPPKVANYAGTVRGSGDTDAARLRRARAVARYKACLALTRTNTERLALERVAGEGRTIRSLVNGGRSYERTAKALSDVLSRIADRYI
jgi:hypothetical protein